MLTRRWRLLLWTLLWVALCGTTIPAQEIVRIAPQALESVAELERLLAEGSQLERQERWGEALSHYENALRHHPDRSDLQQRLITARLHYDLGRRYVDSSFLHALSALNEQQALQAYREVLLKIQTHYVHEPDWHELLERGSQALQVALDEDSFRQRHLASTSPDMIAAFRTELDQQFTMHPAQTREDVVQAVNWAAYRGQQLLRLPSAATILEFTCGAANALDSYSTYLTANQLDEVFSQIDGNFVGLGVELKPDEDALRIVNVIPGSPAALAGIVPEDRIVEVDGVQTSTVSTDAAADMLKGAEGSVTWVTVVSQNQSRRRVQLVRRRVDVPSLEQVRIIDAEHGVAYIRLTNFQKATSEDLDSALWDLHRQGMRSLIIDLRGNPGGLLRSAVEVADKFVAQGPIVSTRGRSSYEDMDYRAHAVGTWRVPLVVLIDGDSASASEIFAGAIRDHRRGLVVGQRSYGKGSVQGIFPLDHLRAGVRLTTAKFYSPSGQPISYRGIVPDLEVPLNHLPTAPHQTAKPPLSGQVLTPLPGTAATNQHDPVLHAALQVARQQRQG